MNDETRKRYVTGYECPHCEMVAAGIEIRHPRDGHVEGWQFRVLVSDVKSIVCSNCGAKVPRQYWRMGIQ